MSFFEKPVRSLVESDLQWLAVNKIAETDRLDFKRDMYSRDDESKRELLRDVTAFANHRGGRIVIGMDEDGDNPAKEVVGVPPGDHIAWIQNLCLSGIDRRILGLDIVEVPVANGRVAIVVNVPLTANGPHMVTFRGLNQFWKRHGTHKSAMAIEEIEDGFLRVADSQARVERFMVNRHGEIIDRSEGHCTLVLSAIPVYFRDEPIMNVRSEVLQFLAAAPPRAANGSGVTVNCGPLLPTLEGVAAATHDDDEACSLEVFRNGYIEFTSRLNTRHDLGLVYAGVSHTDYLVSFTGFAAQVFAQLLGGLPMLLRVVIISCNGLLLAASNKVDRSRRWHRQHLDLGKYVLEDPAQGWQALPKQVCDRLWNAFGYEECGIIDETATFRRR